VKKTKEDPEDPEGPQVRVKVKKT